MITFADRYAAGRALATRLRDYAGRRDVLVLALPRGGVPVAHEIARALGVPLDLLIVRKLGVPHQPEFAMGAIASGDVCVLNRGMIQGLGLGRDAVARVVAAETAELHRREAAYRGARPRPVVAGRTVIVVDDGLATGATMWAAITALQRQRAAQIVVAAPVASTDAVRELSAAGHTVVTVTTPDPFFGVGRWYDDFGQTTDDEVVALLDDAWSQAPLASDIA